MSKRLPFLKLFLYPTFAYVAYHAYCFYYLQYQERKKKFTPLKFLEEKYD